VTNGVYDLIYCTNLAPPVQWQWVLRMDPGQTNLTAPAPDDQGFYALAAPDDLTATSSLGTNFWLMFYPTFSNALHLFISSPVGATGAIGATWLDGYAVAATNFLAIGDSGYFGARLPVTNGTHIVTSSQPVGVQVYGFDYTDAYGYFGGMVK
jgi:hypothetical protein